MNTTDNKKEMVMLSFQISKEKKDQLKKVADEMDLSVSGVIKLFINNGLSNYIWY